MNSYVNAQLRGEIIERAGNCCEYCGISQEDQLFAFEIDPIIAEKHGGPTVSDNLCLSCPDCNAYKGSDIASIDWKMMLNSLPCSTLVGKVSMNTSTLI
jgi:hypothetical protein